MASELVWYVSYGSNMNAARLACYLEGGRPPGARVGYVGARDHTPPRDDMAVMLPGCLYFGTVSRVWGGGIAFYDHDADGPTAARAYLITAEQFVDVAAQEMHRLPAAGDPLEKIVLDGVPEGRYQAGPGIYETLLRVGERDGFPMLTFTAPTRSTDVAFNQPVPAYLDMLGAGLLQAHGWDAARCRQYFAGCGVLEEAA
ncbi:histone deacetylase [Acidipropionibacterium acidipropionici]|uniref:histone deacetylase n=1 Tax=Acidipropionibacterium acidipropionici TaxID=1748 RepID=UPI00110A2E1C|nr:histone deacetylase [Acidipropionibacterium acidipropionici]QCV95518.1 histone deacetylase [Acidipropionibacterium acidipropionici]